MNHIKNKISEQKQNGAYIKERIYGTITLLATNLGLFTHIENISTKVALATIITTAFGLWLASIFAEILAHKITNHNSDKKSNIIHIKEIIKSSLGIIQSSFFSIFVILLAYIHILPSLKIAILSSIILAIIQLIGIIFFVSIKKENNLIYNIFLIIIQLIIFAIIILLKLGH